MFDPILNAGSTANNVIYTNKTRFQWRCNHNHVFRSTIRDLVKKQDQGAILCPVCRKWETKSLLLVDEYPELFEEAYNWLNCPTLRKPETSDISCENTDLSSIPPSECEVEDYCTADIAGFPFEELYIDSATSHPSQLPITSSPESSTLTPSLSLTLSSDPFDPATESLHRVLHNHLFEYRKWKETLRSDDSRVIWWVCSINNQHIWRESIRSRVSNRIIPIISSDN